MWFRNLVVYRLPTAWSMSAPALEEALDRHPLKPCGRFDLSSRGWVAPAHEERRLYTAHGQQLLALGIDQKLLPASIVNQVTKERAALLEEEQGHPVGRRQMRELKARVAEELRGRALTRRRITRAWLDPARHWLCVDAASAGKAEEVLETLRETLGSFPATPLDTERSPSAAMTAWLAMGDAPARFSIEQDLELKALGESKATIRYSHHPLDGKEIRTHISSGKSATRLGLTFADRLSFVLTDKLEIKRLELLDVAEERAGSGDDDEAAQFEADFVLMTAQLVPFLESLVDVLGGERESDADARVDAAA